MVACTMFGALLAMAGTPMPGVVPAASRMLPTTVRGAAADRSLRPAPAAFAPPSRFALQPAAATRALPLSRDPRAMQHVPVDGPIDDRRRFSPAGVAMGMTWESPISVIDNDRFDMRNLRIDRVSGSKIKGPLDAGLMLKITASTRSMDADLGLTGGARMLSDALTGR